jgi:hypothetical protein
VHNCLWGVPLSKLYVYRFACNKIIPGTSQLQVYKVSYTKFSLRTRPPVSPGSGSRLCFVLTHITVAESLLISSSSQVTTDGQVVLSWRRAP